jgi:hypothetical protein
VVAVSLDRREEDGVDEDEVTDDVVGTLLAREPLFHREPAGSTRAHFEEMTAPDFFEVGASGTTYGRDHVLDLVAARYERPQDEDLQVSELRHRHLGGRTHLVTYLLDQDGRITRRATIWERTADGTWRVIYHQGTPASG